MSAKYSKVLINKSILNYARFEAGTRLLVLIDLIKWIKCAIFLQKYPHNLHNKQATQILSPSATVSFVALKKIDGHMFTSETFFFFFFSLSSTCQNTRNRGRDHNKASYWLSRASPVPLLKGHNLNCLTGYFRKASVAAVTLSD